MKKKFSLVKAEHALFNLIFIEPGFLEHKEGGVVGKGVLEVGVAASVGAMVVRACV